MYSFMLEVFSDEATVVTQTSVEGTNVTGSLTLAGERGIIVYLYVFKGVDQCIQRFLDVARQTECFFLQKRLQLSVQKPEQVEKEVGFILLHILH